MITPPTLKKLKGLLVALIVLLGSSPSVWAKAEEFEKIHATLARIEANQYEYHGRISVLETKAVMAGISTSAICGFILTAYVKTHFKEKE